MPTPEEMKDLITSLDERRCQNRVNPLNIGLGLGHLCAPCGDCADCNLTRMQREIKNERRVLWRQG